MCPLLSELLHWIKTNIYNSPAKTIKQRRIILKDFSKIYGDKQGEYEVGY
jgi:hypothetical protein